MIAKYEKQTPGGWKGEGSLIVGNFGEIKPYYMGSQVRWKHLATR
jgi:hypothetical protein